MALLNNARTPSLKEGEIRKDWKLLDATGQVLGCVAVLVANLLRGKHKPQFTPHMDCGDYVVVVNVDKIKLTGKKLLQKVYYHHTGYPGGIKSKRVCDILSGKNPEQVLIKAVKGMLPKGALAHNQLRNLKVYAGSEHRHQAQNPVMIQLS